MKKLMACILSLALLCPLFPVVDAAPSVRVPILVTEQNGVLVNRQLFRRGIAFAEGELYNTDDLCVVDAAGGKVDTACEVTERYADGSIKWLLCSFVIDLAPNESKQLYLQNNTKPVIAEPVQVVAEDGKLTLSNQSVRVVLNGFGIMSLDYQGNAVLGADGFGLSAIESGSNEEKILCGAELTVIAQTDLYARVSAKGRIGADMTGEVVVTLWSGGNTVDVETRYSSKGAVRLSYLGNTIHLSDAFRSVSYPQPQTCCNRPANVPYIIAENGPAGIAATFATRDNERFRGAVSKVENTGFLLGEDRIRLAPMINGTNYTWCDGLSRTNHLTIQLGSYTQMDNNALIRSMFYLPSVQISPEQFEKSGLIAGTAMTGPIQKMIDGLHSIYDKRDGRFEAGSIPFSITGEEGGMWGVRPGETNYHMGQIYMATADDKIYNMMAEDAESWADVLIYRGKYPEILGAGRYYSDSYIGSPEFEMSHPFYGTPEGLYMAYVLTGNEYLRDSFSLAVDCMVRTMYDTENMGMHMPRMWNWSNNQAPTTLNYVETRYIIQARSMYLAYELFGDETYLQAAQDIALWAKESQQEDGYWYQAYYDDGTPLVQGNMNTGILQNTPAAKIYIFLYGARGLSDYCSATGDKNAQEALLKLSDFLLREQEQYGPGLWDPMGNPDIYLENEDSTRGKSPMEDNMAVQIFLDAYLQTGEQVYLRGMLTALRSYMTFQMENGFAPQKVNQEGFGYGGVGACMAAENLTLLAVYPAVMEVMEQNRETVKALGFEDLLIAFANDSTVSTVARVSNYSDEEVFVNSYESNGQKVLFALNATGNLSQEYEKEVEIKTVGSCLWQGMKNEILSVNESILHAHMEQFDTVSAIERPLFVRDMNGTVIAEILQYDENAVKLSVSGTGTFKLTLEDGLFAIEDGAGYQVSKSGAGQTSVFTITAGGEHIAQNGSLLLDLDLTAVEQPYADLEGHWAASSVAYLLSEGIVTQNTTAFEPDQALTVEEFAQMLEAVAENSGRQLEEAVIYRDVPDLPGQILTRQQAARMTANVLMAYRPELLMDFGIYFDEFVKVQKPDDKNLAVKLAAEAIEIPELSQLQGNIALPNRSLFSSHVTWASSNEALLSSDGVVNRNVSQDTPVTLTATVTLDGAQYTRELPATVLSGSRVNWPANKTLTAATHLIQEKSGVVDVELETVVNGEVLNAVVALSDSQYTVSTFSDLPVILRFNPEGQFDACNGPVFFEAENPLSYEQGKTYQIKLTIDTDRKTYSAVVQPEGGEPVVIADNYRFRDTAPQISKVDVLYNQVSVGNDNDFTILRCSLAIPGNMDMTVRLTDDMGRLYGKYLDETCLLPNAIGQQPVCWFLRDPEPHHDLHNGTLGIAVTNEQAHNLKADTSYAGDGIVVQSLGIMSGQIDKSALTKAAAAVMANRLVNILK